MTDPKDELGARFDDRRADSEDTDADNSSSSDDVNNAGNAGNADTTENNSDNTSNAGSSGNTGDAGDTSNKPGPDKDETATRHRRQVPMYLPDEKASEFNKLYERLDGRSKVAGEGAIEKHADFMEALVEFAIDHEDDLAERLDIK